MGSGKIETDASQWITYQGEPLKCNAPYYWKVKVYTNKGEANWSNPAFWSMGLFNEADWRGQWIGLDRAAPGDSETQWSRLAARYLRKEFALKKEVKQSHVHVARKGADMSYSSTDNVLVTKCWHLSLPITGKQFYIILMMCTSQLRKKSNRR